VTHEAIRQALSTGCSEEELKAIRCPVCGGEVTFHVHPRRRMFFIRCVSSNGHMAMSGTNPASPDWWEKYVEHDAWMS
jgi:hypothetical protein